jgi:hypothetical protein
MNVLLLKLTAKEGLNRLVQKKRKRKKRKILEVSNKNTPKSLKTWMKM